MRLERVVRTRKNFPIRSADRIHGGVDRGGAIYCLSSASHASTCGRRLYLSGVRRYVSSSCAASVRRPVWAKMLAARRRAFGNRVFRPPQVLERLALATASGKQADRRDVVRFCGAGTASQ